jgi:peptide/nickel transport system substrate-binding protein
VPDLRPAPLLLATALACGLAAGCGDDGDDAARERAAGGAERLLEGTASENRPGEGRRGGRLTVLSAGDVDTLDPGQSYYAYTWGLLSAMHRTLYTYRPDRPDAPVPDLAEGPPEVAPDGRTVTVRLRDGVRFSRPVGREVRSADVKYAIERGFTENVLNGYVQTYFGDLVGAPREPGAHRDVAGIGTPDARTLVFRLRRGTGAVLAGALALPITAPVPEEYARRFDRESPSTYGGRQVFTGPYKVRTDAAGRLVGHRPGRRIEIVRNPDHAPAGDLRPAFLDAVTVQAGNDDATVAARRILGGRGMASGDGGAPPPLLRRALTERDLRDQVSMAPGGGPRFLSLDTQQAPFDDRDVRRAVVAGFDRAALRLARGGEAIGPIATHLLPPGTPGHEEAGGLRPPAGADELRAPGGDRRLMAAHFRRAGFASGRYEGDEEVLLVGDAAEPERSVAQVAEQQLREMGFRTRLRLVERGAMFTRFCGVPAMRVDVCTAGSWQRDFADPQTVLEPLFRGTAIAPSGNTNWSELAVPEIDRAMDAAAVLVDPAQRARAWAAIDRQVVLEAPVVPFVWDMQNMVASDDVRLVQNAAWTTTDLSFTSLER